MEYIFQNVNEIRKDDPDVIMIFSCAGRKAFWGDSEIGKESSAFEKIAPSSGFYTLSEWGCSIMSSPSVGSIFSFICVPDGGMLNRCIDKQ